MPDELRLEEQALSQAAEIGISSQLDAAENIDVDVRTSLLKMILGQADSVSVVGTGLVMQKDIRVQEMELHTDSVDINLLKALSGQIELNQPIDVSVSLTLNEEDINRALNSSYIRSKLQNLDLKVDGQIASLKMQQMKLLLPGGGKMVFSAKALLQEMGNTRQIGFTAAFRPRTQTQPVMLELFNCTEGEGFSLELVVALMQTLKQLVNLPHLELEGVAVRVKEMEVQQSHLKLQVEAHIRQLPLRDAFEVMPVCVRDHTSVTAKFITDE